MGKGVACSAPTTDDRARPARRLSPLLACRAHNLTIADEEGPPCHVWRAPTHPSPSMHRTGTTPRPAGRFPARTTSLRRRRLALRPPRKRCLFRWQVRGRPSSIALSPAWRSTAEMPSSLRRPCWPSPPAIAGLPALRRRGRPGTLCPPACARIRGGGSGASSGQKLSGAQRLVVDLGLAVVGGRRVVRISGSSGVIGVSITPTPLPPELSGAPHRQHGGHGDRAVSALAVLQQRDQRAATATAVPLSVCTCAVAPPSGR